MFIPDLPRLEAQKQSKTKAVDRMRATLRLCEIAITTNHHRDQALRAIAELQADLQKIK